MSILFNPVVLSPIVKGIYFVNSRSSLIRQRIYIHIYKFSSIPKYLNSKDEREKAIKKSLVQRSPYLITNGIPQE